MDAVNVLNVDEFVTERLHQPALRGTQTLLRFSNGYGASIVPEVMDPRLNEIAWLEFPRSERIRDFDFVMDPFRSLGDRETELILTRIAIPVPILEFAVPDSISEFIAVRRHIRGPV